MVLGPGLSQRDSAPGAQRKRRLIMISHRLTNVALVAAAFAALLAFGCGATDEETGSVALEQTNNGQCNRIIANGLRNAKVCYRSDCSIASDECQQFRDDFGEYFFGDLECDVAFADGDSEGLAASASVHPQTGETKNIGEVICFNVDRCGLCPFAPSNVCPETCGPSEI